MKKNRTAYEIDMKTLGFYIDRLLYSMIKRQNKMLKEAGSDLQHTEFITLKVLDRLESATQTELADVMGKERSGIGRALASLEEKGYVSREPLNGSTNIVTLTEKGKGMKPLLQDISARLTGQAFKGLSEKRQNSVLSYLDKLYQNMQPEFKEDGGM